MLDVTKYELHIGWPVQYFETGDRTAAPSPARIMEWNERGICVLVVDSKAGGFPTRKTSARHVNDPDHEKNPRLAALDGTWDFIPGLLPRRRVKLDLAPDLTDEIRDALRETLDVEVVAKRYRSQGVKKDDVQKIYDSIAEELEAATV